MIFGFGHHILSIFGQQGGTWGPAPTGEGTPADQDMEDLYTIRVGIDTGDTQAQMQAFSGNFKNLGQDVSQTSAMIHAGFRRINRYLGLLGINISGMGMARQLIEVDQAVRNLQRGMFDATREATRGGGAMLQWTEMNDATMQQYMRIVARAREDWRRSEQEIVGMFRTVGRSGIAAAANIQISTDDINDYLIKAGRTSTDVSREWAEAQLRMQKSIEEVGEAVSLGFKLEFLGLSAQQISSLYHSMSVNLRMDMAGIEDALYKVFVTSEMTSFAWQEHIRYVERALAQYSKLGVTIYDVSALLLTMVERVRAAEGAFDRVGVVYELVMDRMGIRQQLGPEQQMRLFQMIRPGQIGEIIGAPGTPARTQFEENLGVAVSQLGPGRGFTTQELLTRRLDPTQYLVVWQSMNEGMMNLVRLQAMQNVMGQLGPRGAEMMPIWAAQMPEFATFWREFQSGLLLDPQGLRQEFQAWRDAQTHIAGEVRAATGVPPEGQAAAAQQFWSKVEQRMGEVYDILSGWRQDSIRWWRTIWLQLRSGDYRLAHETEQARQELTERTGQRAMAAEITEWGTQKGIDISDIENARLRRFMQERFGGAGTEEQLVAARQRTSAEIAQVMQEYIQQTPEGAVFDPVRFTTRGWGIRQRRFLGLTTPEFWSMFTRLRTLPGGEELRNIIIPQTVEEAITETFRAGELVRRGIVAAPGGAAVPTLETVEERQRRREMIQALLRGAGITEPSRIRLGAPALEVEGEPTSMGAPRVPGALLPGGGRRTSIDALREEGLALGGGTRPGELPVVQLTAHLHMAPGQTITFQDVVTQVEMANARTRNIAGVAPGVG